MNDVGLAWLCALIFALATAWILLSRGFRNNEGTALMVGLAAFLGLIFGSAIFLS